MIPFAQKAADQANAEQIRHLAVKKFLSLLEERPLLMGILNTTPDSFSDGGRYDDAEAGIEHSKRMIDLGADVIDIGAESTRPGATALSVEDELNRLKQILPDIMLKQKGLFSIDTYKAEVAAYACGLGVGIVNDVWGFERDPNMASVVSDMEAVAILMHNRESIDTSIDIIDDIALFMDKAIKKARDAGIPDSHIVIDPGIGFGKTPEQNFEIIRRIQLLKTFGFPILIGLSNKRMIGSLTGKDVDQRLYGTLSANIIALMNGADIIRVHDVEAHMDAMKVFSELGKL